MMYDAQRDVESARVQDAPNLETLSRTLNAAKHKALETKLAFEEHVNKHGCSA